MASFEYVLTAPPSDDRARELWLQHAAGFILFEDARQYAIDRIDSRVNEVERKTIIAGINDAVYGVMMIIDGVSGRLKNEKYTVSLEQKVKLLTQDNGDTEIVEELDLADGDGMCMGFHGWLEDDFGRNRPAHKKSG
jgi:hypothetical protein